MVLERLHSHQKAVPTLQTSRSMSPLPYPRSDGQQETVSRIPKSDSNDTLHVTKFLAASRPVCLRRPPANLLAKRFSAIAACFLTWSNTRTQTLPDRTSKASPCRRLRCKHPRASFRTSCSKIFGRLKNLGTSRKVWKRSTEVTRGSSSGESRYQAPSSGA
jgi:hypothetical protein